MNMRAIGLDACDPVEARVHATLRFASGVTAAFVLCEALKWWPTFMAPVFAAVLLTNLPARPSMKIALVLTLTMALAAIFAYGISSLLRGTPTMLFGLIALCVFLAFQAMLGGRVRVPALLLLISLSTIPVVVMIAPAQAGILPTAMVRGIALALLAIGCVYLPWPQTLPRAAASAAVPTAPPSIATALLSTAIVMPLMLVYLLFGLADALPVIVTTVLLVATFDLQRGRLQAGAMILGNFAGGILGLLMHSLLLTQPNLVFLALLLFVVLLGFGQRIAAGGPAAAVALITCNSMLIILSSAIAAGPGSLSVWLTRLFQFALAGAFAVGMMTLVPQRTATRTTAS